MKLRQKIFMKIFIKIKIYLILVIYSEDSKFYDPSNMKDIG